MAETFDSVDTSQVSHLIRVITNNKISIRQSIGIKTGQENLNLYQQRRLLLSTEDTLMFKTPITKLKSFGDCAFSSYGSRIWNSLPEKMQDIDKIESFKKQLKHILFLKGYM